MGKLLRVQQFYALQLPSVYLPAVYLPAVEHDSSANLLFIFNIYE